MQHTYEPILTCVMLSVLRVLGMVAVAVVAAATAVAGVVVEEAAKWWGCSGARWVVSVECRRYWDEQVGEMLLPPASPSSSPPPSLSPAVVRPSRPAHLEQHHSLCSGDLL